MAYANPHTPFKFVLWFKRLMSFVDPLKPTMSDFQLKVTANDSNLKKKKERMCISRIKRKRKKFKNELNIYWNERDLIFSRKWWMQFEKRMSVRGYFVGDKKEKSKRVECLVHWIRSDFQLKSADILHRGNKKNSIRIRKEKKKKFKNELNIWWNKRDLIFNQKRRVRVIRIEKECSSADIYEGEIRRIFENAIRFSVESDECNLKKECSLVEEIRRNRKEKALNKARKR